MKYIISTFVICLIGISTWVIFKNTEKNQGEEQNLATELNFQDEQNFSQLEQELRLALHSGGITPENYSLIEGRIKELEDRGVDIEKIRRLRTILKQLNVGGISQQSQFPTSTVDVQVAKSPVPTFTGEPVVHLIPTPVATPTPFFTPTPSTTSAPQVSCKSNPSPVFTSHITDISKINYVVPPPTIGAGPSLKTHGYIGTDHARVPVYAPVDMILNTGAHFEGGPYWLGFEVSCEVTLRFGHMTEPIQAVRDIFPATPAPANDSRDQQIKNKIYFKAGDLIGYTTGTSAAGNWDMGIYNSTTNNKYKGDPTWGNSWVYTTAICPFDYFEPSLKLVYTSKFSSQAMAGNLRDGESFCK